MIFYWLWTLGLLGISLSGIRFRLANLSIGWIFYLWIAIGILLLEGWIEPVGHEAEYLRFYHGELPGFGDTSLYPSMQIWWWLWSFLSPLLHEPLVISGLLGAGAVQLLSMVLDKLFQVPRLRLSCIGSVDAN